MGLWTKHKKCGINMKMLDKGVTSIDIISKVQLFSETGEGVVFWFKILRKKNFTSLDFNCVKPCLVK